MDIRISDQPLSAPQMGREVMKHADSVAGADGRVTFRAGTFAVSCDSTPTAVAALARKLQQRRQHLSDYSAAIGRDHKRGPKFSLATFREMLAEGEIGNAAQYAQAAGQLVVFRRINGSKGSYDYGLLVEPEEVPNRPGLYSGLVDGEAVVIDSDSGYCVGHGTEGNKKAKRAAAIEDAARYSDEQIRKRREELGATGFQVEAWGAVLNG